MRNGRQSTNAGRATHGGTAEERPGVCSQGSAGKAFAAGGALPVSVQLHLGLLFGEGVVDLWDVSEPEYCEYPAWKNGSTQMKKPHSDAGDLNVQVLSPRLPKVTHQARPTAWRTILSAAAVLLILNIGSHITLVPQTAILQDIVCAKYYAHRAPLLGHPRADECKVEPVQSEVAYLNAWKDVVEAVPATVLAVPYGRLADRIGRKKVLLLAIAGCLLNDVWTRITGFPTLFPLRAVWFGGLWQLIGAGAATFSSVSFVLVADVCPAEQRYIQAATSCRASYLFRLAASFITSVGAATNLAVLTFLIPALSSFFVGRLDLHEMFKDKLIAQLSGLFLVLGSITAAFRWGMPLGERWMGAPFLIAAACFMLALVAVSGAAVLPGKHDAEEDHERRGEVDGEHQAT
ncbi:uncharacterized protein B0T15DRAFT_495435 [Chaetomium strumarium]|uniref:Major facilitator superfamily (MFS) profile domain-containing protein n=1 Tax=Chaetomium strumarium TaxID=1170767 RepID=A0AAJ0GMU1_9PEZI|nr:hypothetical protein B0T15DRAFT_495435 [Chaetomium strumarium]